MTINNIHKWNNLEWQQKTYKVLLQTAFDTLNIDIATWTDWLTEPLKIWIWKLIVKCPICQPHFTSNSPAHIKCPGYGLGWGEHTLGLEELHLKRCTKFRQWCTIVGKCMAKFENQDLISGEYPRRLIRVKMAPR